MEPLISWGTPVSHSHAHHRVVSGVVGGAPGGWGDRKGHLTQGVGGSQSGFCRGGELRLRNEEMWGQGSRKGNCQGEPGWCVRGIVRSATSLGTAGEELSSDV